MLLQIRRDLSSALREHAQEIEAIVPVQHRHPVRCDSLSARNPP